MTSAPKQRQFAMAIRRRIDDGNATHSFVVGGTSGSVPVRARCALSPEHFKRVEHADVFRLGVWGVGRTADHVPQLQSTSAPCFLMSFLTLLRTAFSFFE